MNFAENLKRFRTACKIKQDTLAKMLGVSRTQIQNYERGSNEPALSRAVEISKLFQVPVDVLCRDNSISPENNTGTIIFRSSIFKQFKTNREWQYIPYIFGAFKFPEELSGVVENWSGDETPREFMFLGSVRDDFTQYLLRDSMSYQEFESFLSIIYMQTGWHFIDKAGTTTFLILKHPDDPGAYYHMYGNVMSGAKLTKVWGDDVVKELDRYLSMSVAEREQYLRKVYDIK